MAATCAYSSILSPVTVWSACKITSLRWVVSSVPFSPLTNAGTSCAWVAKCNCLNTACRNSACRNSACRNTACRNSADPPKWSGCNSVPGGRYAKEEVMQMCSVFKNQFLTCPNFGRFPERGLTKRD